MNLKEISSEIKAGLGDAQTIISKVTEYLPVLEAIVPQDADELKAVQQAANDLAPLVKAALDANVISQDTHDTLQNRLGAVAVNTTVAQPAEEITTPAAAGGLAAIVAAILFLFGMSAMAQTNSPSFADSLQQMEQAITSGTNWSIIGGYGHSLKGNNNLAFGDVAYSFSDNVGVVVGYDALRGSGVAQYNSVKGGVTLKTQIYPLQWTGVASLEKIQGQPFVGDLVATAPDGSVGNIVTTGINFDVYDFKNFAVDFGLQYELRAGEGVFNGNYALFHVGISRKF